MCTAVQWCAACEKLAHLFLLEAVTLHAALILYASTHLLLLLVALESFLLVADAELLLLDDIAGERVHKVLGAGLTCTELSQAVILLLVEHLAVLNLGVYIGANICLAVFCSLRFVGLVLAKHLLEVLFFLFALL